jgi:transcriptional regulator with PAS, ATPase and Fis domain
MKSATARSGEVAMRKVRNSLKAVKIMNSTGRKNEKCAGVITINAGLSELARAYRKRGVAVGSITLRRGGEIYKYRIAASAANAQLIEAQFKSLTIAVSCLSPISGELAEILRTRTTYAAMAAVDWKETPTQLKLVGETLAQPSKMIGTSKQIRELLADIDRAARSTHAVLILGESGTGKTTAASMIHQRGARANQRFVDVNCAAIPDALVESELFGHEKGAFTGAVACKTGLFEIAHKGTLFLDEIGEMKLELQAKLLAAIEQHRIRRVGGTIDLTCDVRIIAASSRDLQQMVVEGKFREDLYYRLSVLEIPIPPLRQRRDDIPSLLLEQFRREQLESRMTTPFEIEDGAIDELTAYSWPGNIRQLHNVVARLSSRAENGTRISHVATCRELARFTQQPFNSSLSSKDGSVLLPADCRKLLPGESLQQFSLRVKRALIEAVRVHAGSVTAASARLGIDRTALYRRQSKLNPSNKQPMGT